MLNQIVLSVVIPFFNEEQSIERVVEEVLFTFEMGFNETFEIILVDDGSKDRTGRLCDYYSDCHASVRSVHLSRNGGQSAALAAGFRAARGQFIATLDGDGQNDPNDISRALGILREKGVDMVVGIRQNRQDNWVRKMSSKLANAVRSRFLGDGVLDTGCSLKVFRRLAMLHVCLFRNSHRYYPALFMIHGYTIDQTPVTHRSRKGGESKYGGGINSRLWVGLFDLCGVYWLKKRALRNEVVEHQVNEQEAI